MTEKNAKPSPKDPTPPAPPVAQPESSMARLKAVFESMTEDDKDRARQAGITIPAGDLEAMATGKHRWGYRCTSCNQLALVFVGDQWEVNGRIVDEPPQTPHHQIMWVQDLPPAQIDRHQPRCQHCKVPLPLNPDGSFRRDRQRIVDLSAWKVSRDDRFDPRAARTLLQKVGRETASLAQDVSRDYNARQQKVSEQLNQQHGPGFSSELEALAQASGAAALAGAGDS